MEEDFVRRLPGSRLEDFLKVIWKTSWKSSGRLGSLLGSRREDFVEVLAFDDLFKIVFITDITCRDRVVERLQSNIPEPREIHRFRVEKSPRSERPRSPNQPKERAATKAIPSTSASNPAKGREINLLGGPIDHRSTGMIDLPPSPLAAQPTN
ncbi:hypothetical protein F2Q70_00000654 [Brassica cretica]|uniref:Uncharacterized protein n=1 Tax=Brassica cretica TaxID=69181 RepID=A0A8S9IMF4_BRACR|nr:hypothetical protein F2Q70_00000654 [Brassica cretica]